VQRLRRLSGRRAARSEEGAFVVDGPTLVAEALAAGVELQEVFATADADEAILDRARAAGAVVHPIDPEVLRKAVDTVTPQALAAIATRPATTVADAVARAVAGPLSLVLVDVNDPGNAGTLVRAAEASGAAAVLFCGASVDPCNPKCVRASAGALFQLPVADGGDTKTVLEDLVAGGVRTVATVVRGGSAYDELDLTRPTAFVLGSEAHGLATEVLDQVTDRCTIPMAGRSESINVAMAGAILSFESLRQRRAAAR
jgi:TrmH family RNA methyltransferase